MPGLLLEMEPAAATAPKVPEYGFVVSHQSIELDIEFSTQSLSGRTEITILPQRRDLHAIRIDARQCTISLDQVKVNGHVAISNYEDPMHALDLPKHILWTANQYHIQQDRISPLIEEDTRAEGALEITVPDRVYIEEVDPFSENAATAVTNRAIGASIARTSSLAVNGVTDPQSATSTLTPKTAAEQSARFQPLIISIPFSVKKFREGLHFVGLADTDARFPHVYTRHSMDPGTASCLFPCIDDPAMRCTWEISIKCSRTLGDALTRKSVERKIHHHHHHHHKKGQANGVLSGINGLSSTDEYEVPLSDEEKLLEMTVVCSGEMIDEKVDIEDSSKKIVSFLCKTVVAAQHIGFAVGPFEQIDLSEYREDEDDEKLGQRSTAVWGYCLPGRGDEVRNSCMMIPHALDFFTLAYGSYPFDEAKFVFVDDQVRDVEHTASMSLCSNRLLFPPNIIDTEKEVVRILAHAVATQWMGVSVVPNEAPDRWVTIGLSHFMTGLFMKSLFGNNDYQFRQKTLADQLVELDIKRPPLYGLGVILNLGSFEYDFMHLKAPLVMYILDKRIIKASGSAGLTRVISKIIMGANTGGAGDSVLSTESFRKMCEKITKYRQTEPFWNQWVMRAGCPRFNITQKFNKKRLCVEMRISQTQDKHVAQQNILTKSNFQRELKEEINEIYAGDFQPLFTGPMTIRIHEADGTPYEHIVEIRDGTGQFEIPYNTKYKRLKRSRRQRERANAGAVDLNAEPGEDTLYYCLGDILQSPQEAQEWGLTDWDDKMQTSMEQESYEWIRIDADFEWLCAKDFPGMPGYMWISQLQQDRDVVAQQESILYLKSQPAHPLAATFLIRTLMDTRYFHGIRTMAADCLKTHAVPQIGWIGLRHLKKAYEEFFCFPGPEPRMPRSNDFGDRAAYQVLLSIPQAVAQIRGLDGTCPREAREFILDQLRFNDNGQNEFSDNYKVAGLLTALTESLILQKKDDKNVVSFDNEDEDDDEPARFRDMVIEELDRHSRMDQWIHSYQNIYTVTVLECKQKLMKAGVIPADPVEFAQYTHDGAADLIRIKAFEALLVLGLVKNDALITYLMSVMSTDWSPFVRHRLFEVFCLGLATVAFGQGPKAVEAPAAVEEGGLIVEENDATIEERKAYIARTTSIQGALAAMKAELTGGKALKEAIWKAIKSPVIGASEQSDLLDICQTLYDRVTSVVLSLKLPRYWKAEKVGKVISICATLSMNNFADKYI